MGCSASRSAWEIEENYEPLPTPGPVVDTYFRGPLLVMYDAVCVTPTWREWSGAVTCRVTAHVEAAADGSLRGTVAAWRAHEVPPGQRAAVGSPKSLGYRREEGLVLVLTVHVRAEGGGGGSAGSPDVEPRAACDVTLHGRLLLDQSPLELLEPRTVALLDLSATAKPTIANILGYGTNPLAAVATSAASLNDALLRGARWGELTLRFLPEPPRVKTVFWVRHAESEWNAAQRQGHVLKMMGQVDHPLTPVGVAQARELQRKVAAAVKLQRHDEQQRQRQQAATAARVGAAVRRAKQRAGSVAARAEAAARQDAAAARGAKKRGLRTPPVKRAPERQGRGGRADANDANDANDDEGLSEYDSSSRSGPGDDAAFAAALLEELRALRADALAASRAAETDVARRAGRSGAAIAADGSRWPPRLKRARPRRKPGDPWEAVVMEGLAERLATHVAAARAQVAAHRRDATSSHRHGSRSRDSSSRSPARGAVSSSSSSAAGGSAGARPEGVAHLERRFLRATVLCSPLCRALQTALLALGPSGHFGAATGGVTLLATAREVKKTRGSFDCAATATGAAVRQRAVDLLAAAPLPSAPLADSDDGGDAAPSLLLNGAADPALAAAAQPAKASSALRGSRRRRQAVAGRDAFARDGAACAAAAAAERAAVGRVAVHAGDAGNAGCKWWTAGVETARDGAARVQELVAHLALLPDADLVVVGHSHLIREVFRAFADAPADGDRGSGERVSGRNAGSLRTSPVARELCDRKLENCGVVATRFDFGAVLPSSSSGGGDSSGSSGSPAEKVPGRGLGAPGGTKQYVTDAVYLFGSAACKDKAEKKLEKAQEKEKAKQQQRQ